MVLATQRHRQQQLADSTDSLARSLHKDVDYRAVNVSRRSPDQTLGPDSRYPTPTVSGGQRKRQNTLLDTGWHTCFKNNNYVFVRNGNGTRTRYYGDRVKDTNSDITFVIATTDEDEPKQKLVVSLHDDKPAKITPTSANHPTSPVRSNGVAHSSSKHEQSKIKKIDKKKSPGWLKRLRTPGRNKMKLQATLEERTPICESSSTPEESPESLPKEPKIIRITPEDTRDTPVKVMDLIGKGPSTSTPKHVQETGRNYKTLPRVGDPTPHRPSEGRYSVRRRLPYDDSFVENEHSLMQVSPLSSRNPRMDLDLSPLEKPAGCQKTFVESPHFKSILHPTDSMTDIPYADSVEDVFYDNIPRPSLSTGTNKSTSSEIFQPKFCLTSESDIDDVSFDDRRARISTSSEADRPRRKVVRANTVVVRSRHRGRILSDAAAASLPDMGVRRPAAMRSLSCSEPSIRLKRAMSCRFVKSPMEEEENRSLEWHAKQLRSPDDSTVTFSPYKPVEKSHSMRSLGENPVSRWLKELRILTDTECLNALQAKEIIKEEWIANALAVGNAQERAESLWESASAVTRHAEDLVESLKKPSLSSTPLSLKVAQFCSAVVDLLKMNTSQSEHGMAQLEASIKTTCSELLDAINKDSVNTSHWKTRMCAELQAVPESVKVIVKQLLQKHLQVIVDCVERASNINCLKRAVFALILLGRLDPSFCEIVVKLGTVRSLLAIVVESRWKEMHPCALRALTVLSCVPQAIKSFEESGGVECVCDVLSEESASEGARSEAAGLVAQITAPWTEGNAYVLRSVQQNGHMLVKSIATLASKTESSEVFLLSSAALANLSFADGVLKKMKENKVLDILVSACRTSPHATSLFIKDQVATVLANMAAKEEYRNDLCSGGSLVLLLCFLQLRPSVGHGPPQLSACERIQQKAAIALARLCTDPNTSNVVADMQGIQRLVKLCKDRKERNDSDSVLVACLAALRKIAAVRQKEEFKKLGAQELVEPRLWDAFLAHSSKRESYV